MRRPKAWLSWSTGKDSAWALHEVRARGEVEVVALLTTLNSAHQRVAMHAVREALLDAQVETLGLPVIKIPIPPNCVNAVYDLGRPRHNHLRGPKAVESRVCRAHI